MQNESNPSSDTIHTANGSISNVDMKLDSAAEKQALELRLQQALASLEKLLEPTESHALQQLQCAWETYRDALMVYTRSEVGSATNAGLSAVSAWIVETHRRVDEIERELGERQSRLA